MPKLPSFNRPKNTADAVHSIIESIRCIRENGATVKIVPEGLQITIPLRAEK